MKTKTLAYFLRCSFMVPVVFWASAAASEELTVHVNYSCVLSSVLSGTPTPRDLSVEFNVIQTQNDWSDDATTTRSYQFFGEQPIERQETIVRTGVRSHMPLSTHDEHLDQIMIESGFLFGSAGRIQTGLSERAELETGASYTLTHYSQTSFIADGTMLLYDCTHTEQQQRAGT